jgi:hypothetical protein
VDALRATSPSRILSSTTATVTVAGDAVPSVAMIATVYVVFDFFEPGYDGEVELAPVTGLPVRVRSRSVSPLR